MKQLTAILFVAILAVSSAFADYIPGDPGDDATAKVTVYVIEALEVIPPDDLTIDNVIVGTTRDVNDMIFAINGHANYGIEVTCDINSTNYTTGVDQTHAGTHSSLEFDLTVPAALSGGTASVDWTNMEVTGSSAGQDVYNLGVSVVYDI